MRRYACTVSIVLFVLVFGCSDLAASNGSSGSEVASGAVLWLDSKTIDLGVIASDQGVIVGVIPMMNDGDEAHGGAWPRLLHLCP